MRVAFDATPLLLPRTGIGSYSLELIRALSGSSHESQPVLMSNRPFDASVDLPAANVQVHSSPSRLLWLHTQLPLALHRQGFDIAHFPNNSAPLLIDIPYVLTIHDASLYRFPEYHPWRRKVALKALLPLAARRAAAIITVSEHAKRELMHYLNLPASRFTVVPEAAGGQFRPISCPDTLTHIRNKYQLPQRFVLSVGTQEPRKNLGRLVEAFGQVANSTPALTDVKLVIVGGGGWGNDTVTETIKRLGLEQRVLCLGHIADAELPVFYSMATLFAYPSLHEGFGLPPLEAMASGTAVLTSQDSAMQEVCNSGAAYCEPRSVDSISAEMRRLLCDSAERDRLAHRGSQVATRYSWQRTATQTEAIYNEVLAEKRGFGWQKL